MIVDLVPENDPIVFIQEFFRTQCFPMRIRHILDPLDVHYIVDVILLVNVGLFNLYF